MRYHDFHLAGYSVRQFGREIVLHLLYKYPPEPLVESHLRFSDVEFYHFVHTGGAIITDLDETSLTYILDCFWDRMDEWFHWHGGPSRSTKDRAIYQQALEAESYKAWNIGSALGFAGVVIAKSIEDVTHEYSQTPRSTVEDSHT
jgi:hypothetical protein